MSKESRIIIIRNTIKDIWRVLVPFITHEKTPLTLAVVAQAFTIGLWMFYTGKSGLPWLDGIVATITSIAIDQVIVSTAFGEKKSRNAWILSIITSIVAWVFSCLIAVYLYNFDINTKQFSTFDEWTLLHIAFPTLVLLYSWYLSVMNHDKLIAIPIIIEDAVSNFDDYKELLVRRLLGQVDKNKLTLMDVYNIIGRDRKQTKELIEKIRGNTETE